MMMRARVLWTGLLVAGAAIALSVGYRAHAAPNADAIFAKARKVAGGAKSLKATIQVTMTQGKQTGGMTGAIELLRPNYGRITLKGSGAMAGSGTQHFISTGKKLFVASATEKKYLSVPAEPKGENLFLLVGRILTPVVGFTSPGMIRPEGAVRSVGSETRGGKTYKKVVIAAKESPTERALFFGSSGLLEGMEFLERGETGQVAFKIWLQNPTLNAPLTAKRFAYSPPAGYTVRDTSNEGRLLAIGTKAPEFTLPGAFGGKYSLNDLRKGKKATLVSFWFYNCGPCRIELPQLAKHYPAWKKRGLGLVAINTDDDAKIVQQYIFEEKLNYPVALAVNDREKLLNAYKVEAFPTVYLLDRNGKVVWRRVGLDPEGLEAAIEKALK